MDENNVAGLTRTFTHVGTRRAALGLLATALGGSHLPRTPPAKRRPSLAPRSCTVTPVDEDCVRVCCPNACELIGNGQP